MLQAGAQSSGVASPTQVVAGQTHGLPMTTSPRTSSTPPSRHWKPSAPQHRRSSSSVPASAPTTAGKSSPPPPADDSTAAPSASLPGSPDSAAAPTAALPQACESSPVVAGAPVTPMQRLRRSTSSMKKEMTSWLPLKKGSTGGQVWLPSITMLLDLLCHQH